MPTHAVDRNWPTIVGNSARGTSSPLNPAFIVALPLSITIVASSADIFGQNRNTNWQRSSMIEYFVRITVLVIFLFLWHVHWCILRFIICTNPSTEEGPVLLWKEWRCEFYFWLPEVYSPIVCLTADVKLKFTSFLSGGSSLKREEASRSYSLVKPVDMELRISAIKKHCFTVAA